jgi:hypothetical protein
MFRFGIHHGIHVELLGRIPFLLRAAPFPLVSPMSETPKLLAASAAEIAEALAFALRYEGRKRVFHADEIMARITANQLVAHLTESGFVVMKAPPAVSPTTSNMPTPRTR